MRFRPRAGTSAAGDRRRWGRGRVAGVVGPVDTRSNPPVRPWAGVDVARRVGVAGDALGHGLVAYSARPHWLVVVAVSAVAVSAVAVSAVAPAVLGAVVHLAVLATHTLAAAVADQVDHGPAQVDHYPDQARPGTDQADQHPDRDAPAAAELLAELNVPGWVEAGWSGEVDQHPDQSGPGADQARTAVPNQSADDPILAADLRRWAADQVGPAVAERGDEPLRDRHDPRQPATRRPTPVRHRIRGGPRTGPRRTSNGPQTGPLTDRREETG